MEIPFSTVQLAALQSAMKENDTSVADVVYRFIEPLMKRNSEALLQTLADKYRSLSPEKQLEAVELLRQWAEPKPPTPDPPTPRVEEPVNSGVR